MMAPASAPPEFDPFADNIVNEPRQIERAIESLNADPLERVLRSFGRLLAQPCPRLQSAPNVILVQSPEPGFGKSHLVGRLFRRLDDEATLIYLRPYQDPSSCWIAVLERIIAELDYPDRADAVAREPGELSQLDVLARRVLVFLLARLLEDGTADVPSPQGARDFFQRFPSAVFETPEWRNWLQRSLTELLPKLDAVLARASIHLHASRSSWLRVLFAYAFSEEDLALRQTCLEWLRYEPIGAEDAERIGLRPAELPDPDVPYEQRNERCFQRIQDLFLLAAFYRPFLLCFDQTELYGGSEELARSLGVVLSRLRREAKNHLTLVTGNEFVWRSRLVRFFEKADQDAIAPEPLHLEGINASQARLLLEQRLRDWEVPQGQREAFLGAWVDDLFSSKRERSVRDVLREASRRWSDPPPVTPKMLFEAYRQRLLADPKRLAFDPGVFQLVVEKVLGPAAAARVTNIKSRRGYFTLQWQLEDAEVLFGFQSGSHWKTWEAIVREANQYRQARASDGRRLCAAFFRTEEQKTLPERSRASLEQDGCVRLLQLGRQDAASLYAAHDLYADVQQGNQEIESDELLEYLRQELKGYAERVFERGPEARARAEVVPIARAIEELVRSTRIITLDHVARRLSHTHRDLKRDDILGACGQLQQVRVISSPLNVILRWIPSASA